MRMISMLVVAVALAACASGATVASADANADANAKANDDGMLVRVGGDLDVGRDEGAGSVIVFGGAVRIHGGYARTVLVVGGSARLDDARIGDLTVMGGHAALLNGSRVRGDVRLIGADLERDPDVLVGGAVTTEAMPRWGIFPFGFLFAFGVLLAMAAAGALAVALAPTAMRELGTAVFAEPGKTAVAALLVWTIGPGIALLAFLTVAGIPLGVGVGGFVLPALAFVGYLVVAVALGNWLLVRVRHATPDAMPYRAAFTGVTMLILIGLVPVAGALVGVAAALMGSGAIARLMWQRWRARRNRVAAPPTTAVA